jgi:hypothetical protein
LDIIAGILLVAGFLWLTFKLWLYNIFISPFSNFEVFWVLTPVYIGMLLAELFQEKRGTSMGNAISNSVVVLWGGIDFLRLTVNAIGHGESGWHLWVRLSIALAIIGYGIFIIIAGLRAKSLIKHVGRIREVSYCIIIFAPLYYAGSTLTLEYLFGAVVYFPIFYFTLEFVDMFLPDPKAFVMDAKEGAEQRVDAPSAQNTPQPRTRPAPPQSGMLLNIQPAQRRGFIAPSSNMPAQHPQQHPQQHLQQGWSQGPLPQNPPPQNPPPQGRPPYHRRHQQPPPSS